MFAGYRLCLEMVNLIDSKNVYITREIECNKNPSLILTTSIEHSSHNALFILYYSHVTVNLTYLKGSPSKKAKNLYEH